MNLRLVVVTPLGTFVFSHLELMPCSSLLFANIGTITLFCDTIHKHCLLPDNQHPLNIHVLHFSTLTILSPSAGLPLQGFQLNAVKEKGKEGEFAATHPGLCIQTEGCCPRQEHIWFSPPSLCIREVCTHATHM